MAGRIIDVDSEGNVSSVEPDAEARERLSRLAWLLDSSIPIPGTRFTIGLDAIIGLFPFVGDLIGVVLSSYILSESARMGAPRVVLLRMAFNVAIDGVVGMVPLLGDLFDAGWKANQRNVRLLDRWIDSPRKAERSSRLFAAALIVGVACFLALLGAAAVALLKWLIHLF